MGNKQDRSQYHCFDIQGAGFFQTPGIFIDSPGTIFYCNLPNEPKKADVSSIFKQLDPMLNSNFRAISV